MRNFIKIKNFYRVQPPDSITRIIMDLVSMGFIFFEMIQIPVLISFDIKLSEYTIILSYVITTFFGLDIISNFNTGYFEKGK